MLIPKWGMKRHVLLKRQKIMFNVQSNKPLITAPKKFQVPSIDISTHRFLTPKVCSSREKKIGSLTAWEVCPTWLCHTSAFQKSDVRAGDDFPSFACMNRRQNAHYIFLHCGNSYPAFSIFSELTFCYKAHFQMSSFNILSSWRS